MTDQIDSYTYRVIWSEEDQEYIGLCAELPSLSWLTNTPEKALKGIRRLASEAVDDMLANGEKIPEAISAKSFLPQSSI